MTKEKKAKEKKQRAKRDIVVLERSTTVESYEVRQSGFKTSAAAKKRIRENGADLAGKTLRIASLSEPMVVRVETVSKVNFE